MASPTCLKRSYIGRRWVCHEWGSSPLKKLEIIAWILLSIWVAMLVWPASYWYNAGSLKVADTIEGDQIELVYAGGPIREFSGSYSVIMRIAATGEVIGDARGGPFTYRVGSERPDPLYLEWWAPSDERMHRPPAGSYELKTCWTVHGAFWGATPSKVTCAVPALFTVHPKSRN